MRKIPVYSPYLGGNIKAYVNECIDTGWISSRGTFVDRFEKEFAAKLGLTDSVAVANGTVALHLALTAAGIGPGDEVIVPTFTYVASVNAILQTGARPVYADSHAQTLQLNASSVEAVISRRTKAVMAVHLYGDCCDMDAISRLCTRHRLLLIEDAAEAFGVKWNGQRAGTFGDLATFSFFGNKTITTGEGGAVVARNESLLDRCRHLKGQAVSKTREYWHDALGFNYRMTNIQAAIGLSQLEEADSIIANKLRVADAYRQGLKDLPIFFHDPAPPVTPTFWMCSILTDKTEQRDPLRRRMNELGIETRPFFIPAHTMPHCRSELSYPTAEDISARGINLPSSPTLTQEELERVIAAIHSFFFKSSHA